MPSAAWATASGLGCGFVTLLLVFRLRPASDDEGVGSTHLFRVSLPASLVEDLSIAREQRSELRNMRF